MASYLGMVDLGTLRKDGVEQPRPTKPWRIDSEPYTGAGTGDIADFSTLQDMSKWVIGNTSATAANKLRWHKIQDGNKTLLICDRGILAKVSWNDLNSQGLITGKTVTIDGHQYKLRVLTGGEERREGGTGTSYEGGKLPNEWDSYIVNEAGMAGAPTPNSTDLGSGPNASQASGAHNQAWNWMGFYSWCQETYKHNSAYRANRGINSARSWGYNDATSRNANLGWRPALEILNSAHKIIFNKPITIQAGQSLTKVKLNAKQAGVNMQLKEIGAEKYVYTADNQNTNTADIEVEGEYVTLDKLAYTIN